MNKLCTYRVSPQSACRCKNGLQVHLPRNIIRHWKDGLLPALGRGEALCDQHGDAVPEWMIAKEKRR